MLDYFLRPYAQADLVTQTRSRNLFWVLAPFLVVALVLGLTTLFTADPQVGVIAVVLVVGFGAALVLLARGRYRDAANLAFGLLLAAAAASEKPVSGDAWKTLIFRVASETELASGKGFGAIYAAFLGRSNGPRAGWLLASLEPAFVVERLRAASGQ